MPPNSQLQSLEFLGPVAASESYRKHLEGLIALNNEGVWDIESLAVAHGERKLRVTYETLKVATNLLKSGAENHLSHYKSRLVGQLGSDGREVDLDALVRIAVKALFMIDFWDPHGKDHVVGNWQPNAWLADQTLSKAILDCFTPESRDLTIRSLSETKATLTMAHLKRKLGLNEIVPTNDIAKHLVLDQPRRKIYVFHQAGFLMAQLNVCLKEAGLAEDDLFEVGCDEPVSTSLARGTLPPQLLLETLLSLHWLLIPYDDQPCNQLLKRCIKEQGFDSALQNAHDIITLSGPPRQFEFKYLGARILYLQTCLNSGYARNKWEAKLQEWQKKEGNALLVALLALLISIVVGVFSLIVAMIQTWIAWESWKVAIIAANSTSTN